MQLCACMRSIHADTESEISERCALAMVYATTCGVSVRYSWVVIRSECVLSLKHY